MSRRIGLYLEWRNEIHEECCWVERVKYQRSSFGWCNFKLCLLAKMCGSSGRGWVCVFMERALDEPWKSKSIICKVLFVSIFAPSFLSDGRYSFTRVMFTFVIDNFSYLCRIMQRLIWEGVLVCSDSSMCSNFALLPSITT